jgi:hypothetical protein
VRVLEWAILRPATHSFASDCFCSCQGFGLYGQFGKGGLLPLGRAGFHASSGARGNLSIFRRDASLGTRGPNSAAPYENRQHLCALHAFYRAGRRRNHWDAAVGVDRLDTRRTAAEIGDGSIRQSVDIAGIDVQVQTESSPLLESQ